MLRTARRAATLLAAIALAACQATPAPAPPPTDPPDQTDVFFPRDIDYYGIDLTQADRDRLAELHALRQIDPCGFVDRDFLAADHRADASYTYSAVHLIGAEGTPAIRPIGGDGCTLAFPAMDTALELRVLAGEARGTDPQFAPDAAHRGMSRRTSSPCAFRVELPLIGMAGAPREMRDPVVELAQVNIADDHVIASDGPLCPLAESMSVGIISQVQQRGVPAYKSESGRATAFLTSDPCAAAPALHARGFVWREPRPDAQWPTTWRHPGVCDMRLAQPDGDGAAPSAVVSYGLADRADDAVDVVESMSGAVSVRHERDGVTLLGFSFGATTCFVAAASADVIAPTDIGAGAPALVPPTPIVTVRLRGHDGGDCVAAAEDTALASLQRAG